MGFHIYFNAGHIFLGLLILLGLLMLVSIIKISRKNKESKKIAKIYVEAVLSACKTLEAEIKSGVRERLLIEDIAKLSSTDVVEGKVMINNSIVISIKDNQVQNIISSKDNALIHWNRVSGWM